MILTFLGTGTSHGIPVIGCDCAVCRSDDPRNQRLRPSILLQTVRGSVLVDPTPDFRAQALRAKLRGLDAVLITHTHADHILGLDDLRVFTRNGRKLPVHGSAASLATIRRMFAYACTEQPAWPGMPSLDLRPFEAGAAELIGGVQVRALGLLHGHLPVLGFQFGQELAYLTDCSEVPAAVIEQIRGVTVLVIDGLRHQPHPTHLTIEQAIAVSRLVQPQGAWLTHLCHDIDHAEGEAALPAGVRIAYDGLRLAIGAGRWEVVDG